MKIDANNPGAMFFLQGATLPDMKANGRTPPPMPPRSDSLHYQTQLREYFPAATSNPTSNPPNPVSDEPSADTSSWSQGCLGFQLLEALVRGCAEARANKLHFDDNNVYQGITFQGGYTIRITMRGGHTSTAGQVDACVILSGQAASASGQTQLRSDRAAPTGGEGFGQAHSNLFPRGGGGGGGGDVRVRNETGWLQCIQLMLLLHTPITPHHQYLPFSFKLLLLLLLRAPFRQASSIVLKAHIDRAKYASDREVGTHGLPSILARTDLLGSWSLSRRWSPKASTSRRVLLTGERNQEDTTRAQTQNRKW